MIHFEKFSANAFFCMQLPNNLYTTCSGYSFPHSAVPHLCQKAVTINVSLHVSSIPLINTFIPMTVTQCLDCCSFVANLEV